MKKKVLTGLFLVFAFSTSFAQNKYEQMMLNALGIGSTSSTSRTTFAAPGHPIWKRVAGVEGWWYPAALGKMPLMTTQPTTQPDEVFTIVPIASRDKEAFSGDGNLVHDRGRHARKKMIVWNLPFDSVESTKFGAKGERGVLLVPFIASDNSVLMSDVRELKEWRGEVDSTLDEFNWQLIDFEYKLADFDTALSSLESRANDSSISLALSVGARSIFADKFRFTAPSVELTVASRESLIGLTAFGGYTPWESDPDDGLGPRKDMLLGAELFLRPIQFVEFKAGYIYAAEIFTKKDDNVQSGQLKRTSAFIDGPHAGVNLRAEFGRVTMNIGASYVFADLAVLNSDGKSYNNKSQGAYSFMSTLSFKL